MAVMKKKGQKGTPQISTASLPDIIFMLLFFFMVSTTMRETQLLVKFTLPEATEINKLEKKSLVSFIYIGPPTITLQNTFGTAPRIQLNDSFRQPSEIGEFIVSERDKLDENDRNAMAVAIKVDKQTNMGIVTDVKQELRKAEALKIIYVANRSLGY